MSAASPATSTLLEGMFAAPAIVRRAGVKSTPSAKNELDDDRAEAATTLEYRNHARRLRCQLAKDPARLHRALADLARRQPKMASRNGLSNITRVGGVLPDVVLSSNAERFAQFAREQIDGPIVPFAERQALLRAAKRLGIGRFEANLAIAVEQNRWLGMAVMPTPDHDAGTAGTSLSTLTIWVLVTEAIIAAMTWWALVRW